MLILARLLWIASPWPKSSISMPATYLNCMGDLRTLYASVLPAAQMAGLEKKHFSLMQDLGRCPSVLEAKDLSPIL